MMRISRLSFVGACMALALLVPANLFAAKKAAAEKQNAAKSVRAIPLADILKASRRVDKLIESDYTAHKVEPNALASDEIFVRRLYLDLVGRIPTMEEAKSFLDSKDPQKRSKLIDNLLDSEGYVSHQFNYWADLLRLQSRMRYAPAKPYLDFVKTSLRENKPYNEFVREMITAEGYTWDNGAAGYYIRDTGMPLDNMSNTVQVFLGTQLVCAQCHNHPFDAWSQLQYYELAAFTYGIQTRDRRVPKMLELRDYRTAKDSDREVYRAANRIMRPLAYRVHEAKTELRLPHDYQYGDVDPKSVVKPKTLFGDKIKLEPGQSRKDAYANWMTSADNPRFTTVIANRLWKRVMGLGLIEPVDDFKDGVNPSNPKLMNYLTKQMVDNGFDMKQYLRILYNTKTYQREVTTEDIDPDVTYYFPGPVLQRMSAEQLWDSMLTLTVPYLDERKGATRGYGRYENGEELIDLEMSEIIKMAKVEADRRKAGREYQEKTAELQKELRVAYRTGDREKTTALRAKMAEIRRDVYGSVTQRTSRPRNTSRERDPRWAGLSADLVRASEVDSPARPGHFLRMFGQSDRETIENASTEASVPQILTLLNGPVYAQLSGRNSLLYKNLTAASTPEEKLEVAFLSILSRRPTEREKQLTLPVIKENGSRGVGDVVWALINTRQFMFVQ